MRKVKVSQMMTPAFEAWLNKFLARYERPNPGGATINNPKPISSSKQNNRQGRKADATRTVLRSSGITGLQKGHVKRKTTKSAKKVDKAQPLD
jgi:hypothetical protein